MASVQQVQQTHKMAESFFFGWNKLSLKSALGELVEACLVIAVIYLYANINM